jgi:hypothetical protein
MIRVCLAWYSSSTAICIVAKTLGLTDAAAVRSPLYLLDELSWTTLHGK